MGELAGTNEIARKTLVVLADKPAIRVCYVFGSAAEGRLTSASDIDIALAAVRPLPEHSKDDLRRSLEGELGAEVDLVDLQSVEGLILQEILTRGTLVLAADDEILAGLFKKMWFYEADMMPNYRMILEHRVRKFAYGHHSRPPKA
jgi:predicted nucleotidyltransferase